MYTPITKRVKVAQHKSSIAKSTEDEKKAKETDLLLFLDDISMDFGNDEDNTNFKENANTTRDYINSLDGEDLHYYKKTRSKLPKQKLKEENIEDLRSLVLGSNQYNQLLKFLFNKTS